MPPNPFKKFPPEPNTPTEGVPVESAPKKKSIFGAAKPIQTTAPVEPALNPESDKLDTMPPDSTEALVAPVDTVVVTTDPTTPETTGTEKVKRTRRSNKESKEDSTTPPEDSKPKLPKIPDLDAEEMLAAIRPNYKDEKLDADISELFQGLSAILFEPDMNSGSLKVAVSELNRIRDRVMIVRADAKSDLEYIDSLIKQQEDFSYDPAHKNDAQRKFSRSYSVACYKATDKSPYVNLVVARAIAYRRVMRANGVAEAIEFKRQLLVTMSSAIKTESGITTQD